MIPGGRFKVREQRACSLKVGLFTRLLFVLIDCKTSHWVPSFYWRRDSCISPPFKLKLRDVPLESFCVPVICVPLLFIGSHCFLCSFFCNTSFYFTQVADPQDKSLIIISDSLHPSKQSTSHHWCRCKFILYVKLLGLEMWICSTKIVFFTKMIQANIYFYDLLCLSCDPTDKPTTGVNPQVCFARSRSFKALRYWLAT